jgi:RNA-directed DNA polymerase
MLFTELDSVPGESKVSYYENICDKANLKAAWKKLQKRPSSAGIDEITIADFRVDLDENLQKLSDSLKTKRHKLVKLKPHLLSKPEGGYRVLRIPAVKDRIVQRSILNEVSEPLDKVYDINKNGVSFAYVGDGGVQAAATEIIKLWKQGYCFAYKADIEKFFDNINKDVLLKLIEDGLKPDNSLMELIKEYLYCEVENNAQIKAHDPKIYHPKPLLGVAQGSPLSPFFANVYLAAFDKAIKKARYKMVRYADDLLILTKTLEEAEAAHHFVVAELAKLKLVVHPLKTQGGALPATGHSVPKYSEARKLHDLQFLGLIFRSQKVFPAGRSYQNAMTSIKTVANDTGTTFVKKLISIDVRVFGWCSAYSFTELEPTKIAVLDVKLDDALKIMLRKHGLNIKSSKNPHKALGIRNYSASLQQINNKKR